MNSFKMSPKSSVGSHIKTVLKTSAPPVVTALDKGRKKYVVVQRFEPTPPMPCTPSAFDDFPPMCAFEFGIDGSIDTTTYFVDPKGVIYEMDYVTEVIPAM